MYYKVVKDNKVIDVLDNLTYLKYQPKNKIWLLSGEEGAQAILASDKNTIWHDKTLYDIPNEIVDNYATVSVVPINKFEYEQLRVLNLRSSEEIIDAYTLLLLQDEVI